MQTKHFMQTGIIARVTEKGFGFITTSNSDQDLFFHARDLDGVDFDSLKEGQTVTFESGTGPKGPIAKKVAIATGAATSDDTVAPAQADDDASDEESSARELAV